MSSGLVFVIIVGAIFLVGLICIVSALDRNGERDVSRRLPPVNGEGDVSRQVSSTWGKRGYRVYLRTKGWREKRFLVLKRDHWKCVYCGRKATEVHHTAYVPDHDEPLSWMVSVCHECHKRRSGRF